MSVIKDGTGQSYLAKVTSANLLGGYSITLNQDEYAAIKKGEFFSTTTPFLTVTATEGLMFWVKNNSLTKNLYLQNFRMNWDGGSTTFNKPLFIRIEQGTTQPTTNTTTGTVNQTNLNFNIQSDSKVLYWDEVGTGMTGHVAGTTWRYVIHKIGADHIAFNRQYVLRPRDTISVYARGYEIGELAFSWGFVESDLSWGL